VLLLLLQSWTIAYRTSWRANAQWVLAIRQANAATLDKTVQRVAIKVIERPSSVADVFELHSKVRYELPLRTGDIPRRSTSDHCSSGGSTACDIPGVVGIAHEDFLPNNWTDSLVEPARSADSQRRAY
jgi:hypothetical protein